MEYKRLFAALVRFKLETTGRHYFMFLHNSHMKHIAPFKLHYYEGYKLIMEILLSYGIAAVHLRLEF